MTSHSTMAAPKSGTNAVMQSQKPVAKSVFKNSKVFPLL